MVVARASSSDNQSGPIHRVSILNGVAQALVALLLIVGGSLVQAQAQMPGQDARPAAGNTERIIPLDSVEDFPPAARQVNVGLYAINIHDLDIKSDSYYLSAYVWLRWRGEAFDPLSSLEFINAVNKVDLSVEKLEEAPIVLGDGSYYQSVHVEGRFFQPFDLRRYPLDQQHLTLIIENANADYGQVVYVPDTFAMGYTKDIVIPGWELKGLGAHAYLHDYGTNFGQTGISGTSTFSTVKFAFSIERHASFFLWKLLVPLITVLMTNWFALLLSPATFEVRIALPSTALLTIVFMREAAVDAIPECPSLVLMDKVYLIAYVFIIITLLQVIRVHNHMDEDSPASVARMARSDKGLFIGQILGFFLLLGGVLWWF